MFEEKYEESRPEREERIKVADKKRKLIRNNKNIEEVSKQLEDEEELDDNPNMSDITLMNKL